MDCDERRSRAVLEVSCYFIVYLESLAVVSKRNVPFLCELFIITVGIMTVAVDMLLELRVVFHGSGRRQYVNPDYLCSDLWEV